MLKVLPCLDSDAMAEERRQELATPHDFAAELGRTAVEAARVGWYAHTALVLGAWGCGAFYDDPLRTARDLHAALEAGSVALGQRA